MLQLEQVVSSQPCKAELSLGNRSLDTRQAQPNYRCVRRLDHLDGSVRPGNTVVRGVSTMRPTFPPPASNPSRSASHISLGFMPLRTCVIAVNVVSVQMMLRFACASANASAMA